MNLTPAQIVRIRILHEVMGSKWSKDLTATLKNFSMDANPENELQLSERVVATYLVVTGTREFNDAEKDECWSLLSDLWFGSRDVDRSKLHRLTEDDARHIEVTYRLGVTH